MLVWLADVLRARGLNVVETDGWKTRGRDWLGSVKGVICHHTAGPPAPTAPHASLQTIIRGRADLPGPLSQLYLDRDGTFYVVAAGRSNHAGPGVWRGITTGNSSFIGIEAENAGTGADPWPAVQLAAYANGVAALLAHVGATSDMAVGHKEWALPRGRKVDPSFNMADLRASVAQAMAGIAASGHFIPSTVPGHAMLRRGDKGDSVGILQTALTAAGFPVRVNLDFGSATEAALKRYQLAHGLVCDGKAGPKTWAELGI